MSLLAGRQAGEPAALPTLPSLYRECSRRWPVALRSPPIIVSLQSPFLRKTNAPVFAVHSPFPAARAA